MLDSGVFVGFLGFKAYGRYLEAHGRHLEWGASVEKACFALVVGIYARAVVYVRYANRELAANNGPPPPRENNRTF